MIVSKVIRLNLNRTQKSTEETYCVQLINDENIEQAMSLHSEESKFIL